MKEGSVGSAQAPPAGHSITEERVPGEHPVRRTDELLTLVPVLPLQLLVLLLPLLLLLLMLLLQLSPLFPLTAAAAATCCCLSWSCSSGTETQQPPAFVNEDTPTAVAQLLLLPPAKGPVRDEAESVVETDENDVEES